MQQDVPDDPPPTMVLKPANATTDLAVGYAIPPGSYAANDLPPLSDEAQKIWARIQARAQERKRQQPIESTAFVDEYGIRLSDNGVVGLRERPK